MHSASMAYLWYKCEEGIWHLSPKASSSIDSQLPARAARKIRS